MRRKWLLAVSYWLLAYVFFRPATTLLATDAGLLNGVKSTFYPLSDSR